MNEFVFKDGDEQIIVDIQQQVDPRFSQFIWPSSIVLAEYIFVNRNNFQGKRVIELGSGTSLPGLLCAQLDSIVILTDKDPIPIAQNQDKDDKRLPTYVQIVWGIFGPEIISLPPQDYILAADCFYEPTEFDNLLSTVYFLLQKNPNCKFITVYHERSSKRSIQHLLKKWNLKCQKIPLENFNFNPDKYQNCKLFPTLEGKFDSLFLFEITLKLENI